MENIGIQTTQNVFIVNKTASVGERILATVIDMIIVIIYIYLINILSFIFSGSSYSTGMFQIFFSFLYLFTP